MPRMQVVPTHIHSSHLLVLIVLSLAGGVRIRFDAENSMRLLLIVGASVRYEHACQRLSSIVVIAWNRWLEWTWDVQVSDNGSRTAAVVDGGRLLLTPLAHVVTPPPMAGSFVLRL